MYLTGLAGCLWYFHMSIEPNIDYACEKGFMIMTITLSMTAGKVGCNRGMMQSAQPQSPNLTNASLPMYFSLSCGFVTTYIPRLPKSINLKYP